MRLDDCRFDGSRSATRAEIQRASRRCSRSLASGVTDADSFTAFYWSEQFGSAATVVVLTALGGLGGAGLYGTFRPKPEVVADRASAA